MTEPLKAQAEYFLKCIADNKNPDIVDASKGGDVVKVLCAIDQSVAQKGYCVKV